MITYFDMMTYGTAAVVLTAWAGIFAYVALKGWNGWLALKRSEMEMLGRHTAPLDDHVPSAAARIDMADLKERVRKLEAIASGVDL